MNADEYNDGEDKSEKIAERANIIQKIIASTDVPDLQPDEWVAVIIGSQWYPAQFETYDKESEQIKVTFSTDQQPIQNGSYGHNWTYMVLNMWNG